MIKAIVFDMDGLLLDTEKPAFNLFNDIIGQYGLNMTLDTYANYVGLTKKNFSIAVKKELDGIENTEEVIDSFYSEMKNVWLNSIPEIKRGALRLITYLSGQTIPIAVATSTHEIQAFRLLRETRLLNYFDEVVTGDMVSQSKPAPDIYLETFRRLNVDQQHVIILEDSANGLRAAHASGARPVLIPDMKMPSKEIQQLASGIYPSLIDFLNEIKKEIQ